MSCLTFQKASEQRVLPDRGPDRSAPPHRDRGRTTAGPLVGRPRARKRGHRACLIWALLGLLFAGTALGGPATGDTSFAAPAIELRLPADIVYARAARPDSAVVFSHRTHFAFAGNRCTGCHPALFHMLKRGPAPGHREMNTGVSCGACHDGKRAFGVVDTSACRTCHSGPRREPVAIAGKRASDAGPAPSAPLPKPHTYSRGEDSPGKVTFRHTTHTAGENTCVKCHPKPFRMAAVPPLPDFGMHGREACGACHDGGRTFAVDDPEACSRCHRESGAGP